jgi:hypothetical protein
MSRRFRAVPTPWRSLANRAGSRNEDGFTLIELVIVTLVLPIVIGAIALALVSIFSIQGSVSGRLTGSGDAQVMSSNFEEDVQSAALVSAPLQGIKYIAPTNPAPCASAAQSGDPQVLGLQWGGGQTGALQTEVSYVEVPVVVGSSTTYKLVRNVCQIGSTIPTATSVVSYNVSSGEQAAVTCAATLSSALTQSTSYSSLNVSALPAAVSSTDSISVSSPGTTPTVAAQTFTATSAAGVGATTISVGSQAASGNFPTGSQVVDQSWANTNCGASSGWISAVSLTGITLSIVEPGTTSAGNYPYTLVALPGASSPANAQTTVATPNSSCGFASPGTGTYASSLCFVDFTPYSQTPVSCPGSPGYQQISAPIANTPYTLTFCLKVAGATVAPHIIPTYFSPPTSEAFLGNNGFYTGIPGNPALYQNESGTTTVTIIDIQVLDSEGNAASGWELATGDAESTDAGESLTWTAGWSGSSSVPTSQQVLNLLPNSSTSQIGNACADPTSPDGLTGVGTQTVECAASISSDKTGTVMLEASAPASLTVTMVGTGLQAMFLGLLLP